MSRLVLIVSSMIFFRENFWLNRKPFLKRNGFTLLELLLSVGLMALLAGIEAPMYLSLQAENEVNIAAITIGDVLRRGQLRSIGMDSDSAWGVEMASSTMIIFKGNDFAARDQNFDENYSLAATVNLFGLKEVIFSKLSGWTTTSGTIIITHQDGRTKNVLINNVGVVTVK